MRIGRYEIVRALASGGMATVHLARTLGEAGFERLVAIKLMHPHIASDPLFVGMFLDEAKLAARIRHPNVVATHDVQKSPAGVFLVMDYIDGPSLQAVIAAFAERKQLVPLDVILRITIDALSGLHAAHELCDDDGKPLNLVHRDVSPDNILVGYDGLARITDFGVARAESRISTTKGALLKGKLCFMAPERFLQGQADRRSDVYAAGVTLWEALSGKRLFDADDTGMLITKIVVGATVSPRTHRPDLPEAIESVVMRSIHRDPNARYPTAAAMADALEDAARSAGTSVASPRRVAAFLTELKSEGMLHPPKMPDAALVMPFAKDTTAETASVKEASPADARHEGLRRPWVIAAAAGAFAVGLGITVLLGSRGGQRSEANGTEVSAAGSSPALSSAAVASQPSSSAPALAPPTAKEAAANGAPAPSSAPSAASAAPASNPLVSAPIATVPTAAAPVKTFAGTKSTGAPVATAAPTPSTTTAPAPTPTPTPAGTEFRPGGI